MPENTFDTQQGVEARSPVCIHTQQVTDACLDKDCIEDLRVWLTACSQAAVNTASTVKIRCAELLYADVDTQALAYKKGWYAVDITFYYRISGDAITGALRPTSILGLAIFTKRVVLYGGKSKAKIFTSEIDLRSSEDLLGCDVPTAVLEALDPMVLSSKIKEVCQCKCESDVTEIPSVIAESFGEELALSGESKRLYVTIGQFSTVRLERGTQISVAVCEYCTPSRTCCDEECCEEDPCELFSRIDFPMQAFFPESRKGEKHQDSCCDCQSCG